MTKRAAKRSAAKPRAKRAKTDPVLATLAHAIFRQCQKQSLTSRNSLLEADVAAADTKLKNLSASHVELVNMAAAEEAALVALQEGAVSSAKRALAEATAVVNSSSSTLKRRQVAQQASQTELAHKEVEKITLESAFKDFCFQPVTLGSDGRPQGMTLSLEIRDASWLRGFPESGTHAAASQKPFVAQLEKIVSSDMSLLGATVAAQTLDLGECDAAVQAAEEEYAHSKDAQTRAAANVEISEKELTQQEVALANARQAVTDCNFQIESVRVSLGKVKMALRAFQDGPLAQFIASESLLTAQAGGA